MTPVADDLVLAVNAAMTKAVEMERYRQALLEIAAVPDPGTVDGAVRALWRCHDIAKAALDEGEAAS